MSKAGREKSARERMREERRQQEARQKLVRRLLIGGSAVLVVALVVGIGIFVQGQRAGGGGGEFAGQLPPAKVSNGTVVMAKDSVNAPVVDLYEDFRCPHCQELEERSGAVLKEVVADGQAKVVYHSVAVIDRGSVRAGAASLCAAKQGAYMAYHDMLFEKQPSKASYETLKSYARDVGIESSNFVSCVKKNESKILQNTEQAKQEPGFQGTPTMYINGEKVSSQVMYNPERLREAITSAGTNKK